MARPVKEGLEYFPLDTDIDQDEKMIVVIAKYGMRGFGIAIRLMMELYRNGYYYPWTEKEKYVFAMKIREEPELLSQVVTELVEWGFFDKTMYEEHEILTSKGFQTRYLVATSRRKGIVIKEEYNLTEETFKEEYEEEIKKEKPKNKPKKLKYDEENSYYKMATYFYSKLDEMAHREGLGHLIKRANMQKWADDMRKLIEIDKIDKHTAKEVMDWVVTDPFWKANVLSASKLREQFAKLVLKMKGEQKQPMQQQPKDTRDKEIEFQQWITEGNDPDEFRWN